jgi:hypothetical protein
MVRNMLGSGSLGEDQIDQETPEGPCSDLGSLESVNQDHPPHITHYHMLISRVNI